jgi:hypothetical protein
MSAEEQDAVVGRLMREHKEVMEKRLHVVELVKQIAAALKRLAGAIDHAPNFEEVSKDSILQKYLDLSKIAELVLEERGLSAKQQDYEARLRALGF